MTNDAIMTLLIGYGMLTAGIYGATEILCKLPGLKRIDKQVLALAIGVLSYGTLTALGVFHVDGVALWKQVVASVIFGAVAIGAAGLVHDKLGNPLKEMLKK